MKLLEQVGLIAIVVTIYLSGIAFGLLYAFFAYENSTYARRIFGGIVVYDEVLASRKWQPLLNSPANACTYAIVHLSAAASAKPPAAASDTARQDAALRVGGDWQPTPVPPFLPGVTFTLPQRCQGSFSPELYDRIKAAMAMTGGWYRQDQGETVWLYSRPAQMAFRLSTGD